MLFLTSSWHCVQSWYTYHVHSTSRVEPSLLCTAYCNGDAARDIQIKEQNALHLATPSFIPFSFGLCLQDLHVKLRPRSTSLETISSKYHGLLEEYISYMCLLEGH